MMLVGFKADNHPQQVGSRGALDEVDDRATHPDDFARWDAELGPFTLDAAAAPHNAKVDRFYTRADNGLLQSWAGEKVWCNPPYSDLEPFRDKPDGRLTVRFLPGRLRFIKPGATEIKPNERPPFGCCLLIWANPMPELANVDRSTDGRQ